MFICRRMDKYVIEYFYGGILYSSEKYIFVIRIYVDEFLKYIE